MKYFDFAARSSPRAAETECGAALPGGMAALSAFFCRRCGRTLAAGELCPCRMDDRESSMIIDEGGQAQ